MVDPRPAVRRCAVYTRKSSEEGLEQDFNSLHAQREACEAFILSQKSEGWRLVEAAYDDGGYSGGSMERPGLQKLMADIRLGKVDVIVVYKVDRLTRALSDFARMVEDFDRHGVSFVAVTQQFNTTTSMGRLTLNVLLSFAQFEREVTGERIRDKIAASKKKGMWMGGNVPLGYDVKDRKLIVNPAEAKTVRLIFQKYQELGSVRLLKEELDREGIKSKERIDQAAVRSGGVSIARGALYTLLSNPIYVGGIRHGDATYPGQHEAIIDQSLWNSVHRQLRENGPDRQARSRKTTPSLLAGKLFDETGQRLTPSHSIKNGRRYRYYVSNDLATGTADQATNGWRVPAAELEAAVAAAVRAILDDRVGLVDGLREAGVTASEIPGLLNMVTEYPQQVLLGRIADDIPLMVDRVVLQKEGLEITVSLKKPDPSPSALPPAMVRTVPMQMKRRGHEMRLVIEGTHSSVRPVQSGLLKAVARAHRWFEELASGRALSLADIARSAHVSPRYAEAILPLAFLAPSIVDAIARGQQPVALTVGRLNHGYKISLEWDQQKKVFGE